MTKCSFCLAAALATACGSQPASQKTVPSAPTGASPASEPAVASVTEGTAAATEPAPVALPPLATRPRVSVEPSSGRPPARAPIAPMAAAPAATTAPAPTDAERKKLQRQVNLVRRLLRVAKPSERFDVQVRLADLCAKLAEVELDDAKHARWLGESAKLYRGLADDAAYAGKAGFDRVLFGLGWALMATGDPAGARDAYFRLIKDYPTSRYVPDVYVAFADYYFNQASMESAQRFYEKALQFPNAAVYGYAQYKLGWVYFNLQDYQRALESFFRVVAAAGKSKSASAVRLARAAQNDLVLAYAHAGRPEKAHAFFARVDAGAALEMLERLGNLYRDQGKLAELITARQELLRRAPESPRRCRFQVDVADAALALGDADAAASELERLASLWAGMSAEGAADQLEQAWCGGSTHALIEETARKWHADSEATRDPRARGRAVRLYRTLLRAFPAVAEASADQYYLADALWRRAAELQEAHAALAAWSEAAAAFERCTSMASANAPFLDDAVRAAVLGYQNALAVADALGERDEPLRASARALCKRVIAEYPHSAAAEIAGRLLAAEKDGPH